MDLKWSAERWGGDKVPHPSLRRLHGITWRYRPTHGVSRVTVTYTGASRVHGLWVERNGTEWGPGYSKSILDPYCYLLAISNLGGMLNESVTEGWMRNLLPPSECLLDHSAGTGFPQALGKKASHFQRTSLSNWLWHMQKRPGAGLHWSPCLCCGEGLSDHRRSRSEVWAQDWTLRRPGGGACGRLTEWPVAWWHASGQSCSGPDTRG